jgi:acyl-CoA synthetase (AMP-forming)/AMP-acid ligase II
VEASGWMRHNPQRAGAGFAHTRRTANGIEYARASSVSRRKISISANARPDHVWGEVVVAFVALRSGEAVTEAELIAFARERLADYKIPVRVIFRTELPKGPTGKIQRRALGQEENAFAH